MPSPTPTSQPRRAWWLRVTLALLPVLALAIYGLVGARDEREARAARLRTRHALQARVLEGELLAALASPEGRKNVASVTQITPGETSVLGAAAARLPADRGITFLAVRMDERERPVAFERTPDGVRAWVLAPESIDAVLLPGLVARLFPGEDAEVHVAATPDAPLGPMNLEGLRARLGAPLEADPSLVVHPLSAPFDGWTIRISPRTEASTTRTGPVLTFLGLAILGAVLLARAAVQEARMARLRTDFVSNVSHELRTPLTSIRLFVETLQSGRVHDPEQVRACLQTINEEADRLGRRIERVLEWTRIEADRKAWTFEPVRPVDVVRKAVDAFRAQRLDAPHPVEVDVPVDLAWIRADTDALVEALLNLLANAHRHAGPQAHIRIDARATRRQVRIRVSDDGPGIPLAERGRIFERFYKPDVARVQTGGTGLGLAIVQGILDAHGGAVEVESEEGRGTRFTLVVPRA